MHPKLQFIRVATLAIATIALLTLAACAEKVGEAAAEAALEASGIHDVDIHEDGETVSYRTDEGEVTITGGKSATLPSNFPDDVYLPRDYAVESTLAMNDDLFIGLAVDQDVPALYAAAREGMARHGWKETMAAMENGDNGLLSFQKGNRSAVLSMSREDEGTTMGLQLTAQPELQ